MQYTNRKRIERQANMLVLQAVRDGKLTRPDTCSQCGEAPEHKLAIQAHHEDYRKPLDVEWLCIGCHEQRHREWRNKNYVPPIPG